MNSSGVLVTGGGGMEKRGGASWYWLDMVRLSERLCLAADEMHTLQQKRYKKYIISRRISFLE
ncbi:hypothetical protein [Janthinobacterium sp. RA13]|uniref:hypothetical protein n=1 Tax=Janthinobacterium sp. RA13 TaxID=1502762 RepID=UPI001377B997|nr:hypothetical protein [Janthinobacterium sp. RA13]